MSKRNQHPVQIHVMSGHGTGFGQEDISTLCGLSKISTTVFPGYWEGDDIIQLSPRHQVTNQKSLANCKACKRILRAEKDHARALVLDDQAQQLLAEANELAVLAEQHLFDTEVSLEELSLPASQR